MTELQDVRLLCPVCKYEFGSKVVVSMNGCVGKQTDFYEKATGIQPLPYLIHTCRGCGYSSMRSGFGNDVELSPTLRELLDDVVKPLIIYEGYSAFARYEAAARVAEWGGSPARDVADLLLRAAWCCVDARDTEAERYYRIWAAKKFEEALVLFDGIAPEERATITYLIGELWRRIGDNALAQLWFCRVEAEVVDREAQEWTILIAEQQKGDTPREWFG